MVLGNLFIPRFVLLKCLRSRETILMQNLNTFLNFSSICKHCFHTSKCFVSLDWTIYWYSTYAFDHKCVLLFKDLKFKLNCLMTCFYFQTTVSILVLDWQGFTDCKVSHCFVGTTRQLLYLKNRQIMIFSFCIHSLLRERYFDRPTMFQVLFDGTVRFQWKLWLQRI